MKALLPREWLGGVITRLQREPAVVRVVLAEARGSVPREPGACMLVSVQGVDGTIGGGQLEWDAIAVAHELLAAVAPAARFVTRVLGVDLGQCCGGVAGLWLDCFTAADLPWLEAAAAAMIPSVLVSQIAAGGVIRRLVPASDRSGSIGVLRDEERGVTLNERLDDCRPAVWLFGAGHVGRQLARILVELPLQLTWVDPRPLQFPTGFRGARLLELERPVDAVAAAPQGTHFVIMTHSHPLDYELCRAVLLRADAAWTGLIGSASKAARFRSRLRRDGLDGEAIARLVCPVGVAGIDSKWPAAIAVSVAAQLLQLSALAAVEEACVATRSLVGAGVQVAGCVPDQCGGCGLGAARLPAGLS